VGFDSDEEEKCNFTILSGMKGGRNFDSFDLLLDSGAQVSVVNNPQLLTNLRTDKPIMLFGMDSSGEGIPCDTIGDLLNLVLRTCVRMLKRTSCLWRLRDHIA
jgi:hypothetical protein